MSGKEKLVEDDFETGQSDGLESLFSWSFLNGLDSFGALPEKTKSAVQLDQKKEALVIKGPVNLTTKEFLPVTVDHVYTMSIELLFKNEAGEAEGELYSGFATYDVNKNHETNPPPTNRYFLARGAKFQNVTYLEDDWIRISGTITGAGPSNFTFRNSTKFAKPLFLVNFNRENDVTEIRKITIVRFGL